VHDEVRGGANALISNPNLLRDPQEIEKPSFFPVPRLRRRSSGSIEFYFLESTESYTKSLII